MCRDHCDQDVPTIIDITFETILGPLDHDLLMHSNQYTRTVNDRPVKLNVKHALTFVPCSVLRYGLPAVPTESRLRPGNQELPEYLI